jgi:hypothetical protein
MIVLPIADNDSRNNSCDRARLTHFVTPEGQDKGESGYLEGDQKSLIETTGSGVSLGVVFGRGQCKTA